MEICPSGVEDFPYPLSSRLIMTAIAGSVSEQEISTLVRAGEEATFELASAGASLQAGLV